MPASDFATTILSDLDTESSGGEPSPPPHRESLSSRFLRTLGTGERRGQTDAPMRQHLPASSPLSRDSERAGAGIAPARPVLAAWRESCAARSAHSPPCLYRVIAEGEGDDGEPEQTSPLEVILIASCRPHRCSTLRGKRRRAPLRADGGGASASATPFHRQRRREKILPVPKPGERDLLDRGLPGWTSSCKGYSL